MVEAVSMARAFTDWLGVAARVAPRPPPRALINPLAPLSCSIDAVAIRSSSGNINCPSCGGAGGVCRLSRRWTYYSPHPFLPDNGIECQLVRYCVFSFILSIIYSPPPPFSPPCYFGLSLRLRSSAIAVISSTARW